MRFFIVSYFLISVDNKSGHGDIGVTTEFNNFINKKILINQIKSLNSFVQQVVITSITELNEKDYNFYNS